MRFAKVDLRIWHDERFRSLGPPPANPQYLFLHLLTSPERTLIPGVLRHSFSTIFQQFGWSARSGFLQVTALVECGMLSYEGDLIWLPNALSHNRPANPNVVRGWRKTYDAELPECGLREIIGTAIGLFLRDFPPAFRQAFHATTKVKAPVRRGPAGGGPGAANGSSNGLVNGSTNGSGPVPRTVRRINSKRSVLRTYTPAADAAGSRPTFWRVLRLAQQHRASLQAEPTDGDRMDVLKTLCARAHVDYDGNLCGRVLSDARIAGFPRR
jgi:hypothetical protein